MTSRTEKRCIIISAGAVTKRPEHLTIETGDFVIAADGGVYNALKLEVTPDLIIGDLDSARSIPCAFSHVPIIKYPPEKDETDTFIAAQYAMEKGYTSLILLGALGGRLDHTVANLSVLLHITKKGCRAELWDEQNIAFYLINGEKRVQKLPGYKLSVFAAENPCRGVELRGVKYPLQNAVLDTAYPMGVSNEFLEGDAFIQVKQGTLLIILSSEQEYACQNLK